MITVTDVRYNGIHHPLTYTWGSGKALSHLVNAQLGWSGNILELSPTRIMTETHLIGGSYDIVTFEGPEDEMKSLFEFTVLYAGLLHERKQELVHLGTNVAIQQTGTLAGRAVVIPMLASIAAGEIAIHVILATLLDLPLTLIKSNPFDELLAVYDLHQQGYGSVDELIAMI